MMKFLAYPVIFIIKLYQKLISPFTPATCRFQPTCSQYSIEALKNYGLIKGILMSSKRILSCHPLKILGGGDGFDPVPIKKGSEKINGH